MRSEKDGDLWAAGGKGVAWLMGSGCDARERGEGMACRMGGDYDSPTHIHKLSFIY